MSDENKRMPLYLELMSKQLQKKVFNFYIKNKNGAPLNLHRFLSVICNNAHFLDENEGSDLWESYKKLAINSIGETDGQKISYLDESRFADAVNICLVLISEIYEISQLDEVFETLSELEVLKKKTGLKNASDGVLLDCYKRYDLKDKHSLYLHRKAKAAGSVIDEEITKRLKGYQDKEEELVLQLEELKSNVAALKGDASFLSSSKVFSWLENNARLKEKRIYFSVFCFAVLTFSFPVLVAVYLFLQTGNGLYSEILKASEGGMFWEEVRLIDIKLFAVSSTFVFLGIYFFRVFLSLYQKSSKRLEELELKSAIAFYIEGHVKFVNDSGGDCESSVAKYEDFIFSGNKHDEETDDDPKPTDTLKDIGHVAEKLVKAGRE